MRMKPFAISVLALTFALPSLAEAQQNQGKQDQGKQAQQSGQSQIAQKCLDEVRAFNDEIGRTGYGLAGPNGYFTAPGYGYTWGTAPANGYPALATPRGEMRTLVRAAYVLAMNGDQKTCQTVLDSAKSLRQQRGEQMRADNTSATDTSTWRNEQLATAVPVSSLKSSIRLDQVTGADVRNRRDQDLGDIEDVVLNKQGQIEYVLISRGGFLGIGDELVPVRWSDLSVTPSPYRDTFVLNVPENALNEAPTVGEDEMNQVGSADWSQEVDQFWKQHVSTGGQQSGGRNPRSRTATPASGGQRPSMRPPVFVETPNGMLIQARIDVGSGLQHGLLTPGGAHAGDLPNIWIAGDDSAQTDILTDGVKFGGGANSLDKPGGTSVLVHTEPDDYATNPSGKSGDRVACGVIVKTAAR